MVMCDLCQPLLVTGGDCSNTKNHFCTSSYLPLWPAIDRKYCIVFRDHTFCLKRKFTLFHCSAFKKSRYYRLYRFFFMVVCKNDD